MPPKLGDPWLNLSAGFGTPLVSPPADVTVKDGDAYEAAGFEWQVRSIPGHTAGHVVYLWEGQEPPIVFVGDVIFAGSIGRTDFPDGDHRQLVLGIRSKLFTLPDETILLPGHGGPRPWARKSGAIRSREWESESETSQTAPAGRYFVTVEKSTAEICACGMVTVNPGLAQEKIKGSALPLEPSLPESQH